MPDKDQLLSDLLRLPEAERAEVAHELLLSLEGEEASDRREEAEAEWAREIAPS